MNLDAAFLDLEQPHPHVGLSVARLQNGHQAVTFRAKRRKPQRDDVLCDRRQSNLVHASQRLDRMHPCVIEFSRGKRRNAKGAQLVAQRRQKSGDAAFFIGNLRKPLKTVDDETPDLAGANRPEQFGGHLVEDRLGLWAP